MGIRKYEITAKEFCEHYNDGNHDYIRESVICDNQGRHIVSGVGLASIVDNCDDWNFDNHITMIDVVKPCIQMALETDGALYEDKKYIVSNL